MNWLSLSRRVCVSTSIVHLDVSAEKEAASTRDIDWEQEGSFKAKTVIEADANDEDQRGQGKLSVEVLYKLKFSLSFSAPTFSLCAMRRT
jgi:hypothetical protein